MGRTLQRATAKISSRVRHAATSATTQVTLLWQKNISAYRNVNDDDRGGDWGLTVGERLVLDNDGWRNVGCDPSIRVSAAGHVDRRGSGNPANDNGGCLARGDRSIDEQLQFERAVARELAGDIDI